MRRLLVLACALCIVLGGCTFDNTEPEPEPEPAVADTVAPYNGPRTVEDILITTRDIEQADVDEPFGRVLAWWRALQFGDEEIFVRQYLNRARPDDPEREIEVLTPRYRATRPAEVSTEIDGSRALVFVVLRSYDFAESPPTLFETPTTVRLKRAGGEWRLADDAFLARELRLNDDG